MGNERPQSAQTPGDQRKKQDGNATAPRLKAQRSFAGGENFRGKGEITTGKKVEKDQVARIDEGGQTAGQCTAHICLVTDVFLHD